MRDSGDVIKQYLGDMLALEKHVREAVERQIGDERVAAWPDVADLLRRVEYRLKDHLAVLEQHVALMGGDVQSLVKKAATTVLGAAAGLYDKLRGEDPVSRILRDDYVALNLAAVSYSMLHATALSIKNARVADFSLEHLMDLTPLVVELSKAIPGVVVRELAGEDKAPDKSVSEQAVRDAQRAWSHDVIGY